MSHVAVSPAISGFNAVDFLSDFLVWLEMHQYAVTSDTARKIFQLSETFHVDFCNMNDFAAITKTVVCKNTNDLSRFHSVMTDFYRTKKQEKEAIQDHEKKIENSQNKLKHLQRERKKIADLQEQNKEKFKKEETELRKKQDFFSDAPVICPTSLKNQMQDYLKNDSAGIKEILHNLMSDKIDFCYHPDIKDIAKAKERLRELLKKVLANDNAAEMMHFIGDLYQKANALHKHEHQIYSDNMSRLSEIAQTQQKMSEKELLLKQEIEEEMKKIEKEQRNILVKKEASLINREEYIGGCRCVQTASELGIIGEKKFSKLSDDEKKIIYAYIRRNSAKLKSKLSRKVRSSQRKTFDIQATVKTACSSMGVPVKLCYQVKKPSKPKLVMFLDISGSCRHASELMLVFMHYMRHVFVGGCKTYVFANELYDISQYIDRENPERTIQTVLDKIKTKGVYSDYCTPLKTFQEQYIKEVTKDTILLFIGDARNNKNPSGEEYLNSITQKAKKTYWLATDEKSEWGKGDSLLPLYKNYMDKMAETVNSAQLLDFIENQF